MFSFLNALCVFIFMKLTNLVRRFGLASKNIFINSISVLQYNRKCIETDNNSLDWHQFHFSETHDVQFVPGVQSHHHHVHISDNHFQKV